MLNKTNIRQRFWSSRISLIFTRDYVIEFFLRMVFIMIECDDIDLTTFEVIDVRARIYLARLNQELGPLVVQVNDNFRVMEADEGEILANQGEVRIVFYLNSCHFPLCF